MKHYDKYIFAIGCFLYSFLFYEEGFGINLLLWNIFITGALAYKFPIMALLKNWRWAAFACYLSAISVLLVNSDLAVICNFACIFILGGLTHNPSVSSFTGLLKGVSGTLAGFWGNLFDRVLSFDLLGSGMGNTSTHWIKKHWKVYFIPIIVTVFFTYLYSLANPVFDFYTASIWHLDFISTGYLFFTFFGFLLLWGILRPYNLHKLTKADLSTPNKLIPKTGKSGLLKSLYNLKLEFRSGILQFSLLNILLIAFHFTDIWTLSTGRPPAGVSYSQYVHQGVYVLIVSILFAIGVIMYYFRGDLNFYKGNALLKTTAYLWMAQNAMLAFTTAAKNYLYILEYGLTYKRLGVYFFLFMALIGLITTFWKIFRLKTNWYLLRVNFVALMVFSISLTFFNWNSAITRYNLSNQVNPDYHYLASLSDRNAIALKKYLEASGKLDGDAHDYFNNSLQNKVNRFYINQQESSWKSWNLADALVLRGE